MSVRPLGPYGVLRSAVGRFKQAHAVLQKPSILLNLALSELYSNHPLDAIVHFEEYIKDPSTPADKREKARKHLDEAMKKTAHLQVRTAADAQVSVDGRPIAPPYTAAIHVMPGPHTIEARLSSKTKSATVDPKPGDTVPIDLTFEGEPTPPTPSTDPTTNNPARPSTSDPPPGSEPPRVSPTSSSTRMWWLVPGALGVLGLGSAAVGFVFASQQQSSLDDAEALRGAGPSNICADRTSAQCQAYESKLDDAATQGTISTVSYIGAGAFLVASAITTFIFWPRDSTKPNALNSLIAPLIAPSARGGFASITF